MIATDKTGTLTMNQMTVTALLWGQEEEYIVPIHSTHEENITSENQQRLSLTTTTAISNAMKDLLLGACLCNNAVKQSSLTTNKNDGIDNLALETIIDDRSSQSIEIVGDAADVAMYHLCNNTYPINIEQVKKVNPRINVVPFNSKNKFMITANILEQSTGNNNTNEPIVLVTLKGAPDFVLSRCSTYKHDNEDKILPITDEFRSSIQQRQEKLGKSGYRVIAMIQQRMSKSQYDTCIASYQAGKKQHQQTQLISNEPDLHGLPANNYCFIG